MFKLIWLFFRIGAMNELQYRINFFIQLFQSLVALGTGLIGLALVFSHTTTLAGWSRPELLVVMGVYTLMGGLINLTIQPNMQQLLNDVQQGTLDYILTRPADAQLQVSVRQIHIWSATDILLGIGVLFVAFFQLQTILDIHVSDIANQVRFSVLPGGIRGNCFETLSRPVSDNEHIL